MTASAAAEDLSKSVAELVLEIQSLYVQAISSLPGGENRSPEDLETRKLFLSHYLSALAPPKKMDDSRSGDSLIEGNPLLKQAILRIHGLSEILWSRLHPLARSTLGAGSESEDILHEFYAEIFLGLVLQFRNDGAPFEHLFNRALSNSRKAWLRKRGRRVSREGGSLDDSETQGATHGPNQVDSLSLRELLDLLKSHIRDCGDRGVLEVRVLYMHAQGFEYAEIGAQLGISESNARVIAHRLRKKLRLLRKEVSR